MDDEDIERALQRHRPAGPPRDLRDRLIDGATLCRSGWREWAPAAVALIAAILFYTLAASTRSRLDARVAPFEPEAVDQAVRRSAIGEPPSDASRDEAIEWWLSLRRRGERPSMEETP